MVNPSKLINSISFINRSFVKRWFLISSLLILFILVIVGVLIKIRQPKATPMMKGHELAKKLGCFTCHGFGGMFGSTNPGSQMGQVPPFNTQGVSMFYFHNEDEIREWILYGKPRRLLAENKGSSENNSAKDSATHGPGGIITMPAYKGIITKRELEYLVEYIKTPWVLKGGT